MYALTGRGESAFISESIQGRNKKKVFSFSWVFHSFFSQHDKAKCKAAAATPLIYPFLQQNSSHWACECKHERTIMQRVWRRWVYFPADISLAKRHVWWLNVWLGFTYVKWNGDQGEYKGFVICKLAEVEYFSTVYICIVLKIIQKYFSTNNK